MPLDFPQVGLCRQDGSETGLVIVPLFMQRGNCGALNTLLRTEDAQLHLLAQPTTDTFTTKGWMEVKQFEPCRMPDNPQETSLEFALEKYYPR